LEAIKNWIIAMFTVAWGERERNRGNRDREREEEGGGKKILTWTA
jgi:hypothetical protein